ncbi:hypothetical protein [Streptomyces sp. NPDC058667]|uniref:hypothetical protein n=1 Tax=Streptomyces sp. NPDC058667 TaxID=3346588 RepID=UPI003662F8D7
MNPNMGPPEGLRARESALEAVKACGVVGGETEPQAGAEGFDEVEIHYWDTEKTAEVARLLAQHPPQPAQFSTTTADTTKEN